MLHYAGINESILDITATVRPHLAIVDGIVGMEGDGPIMGTATTVGAIVMGTNLPAVDATAARLMEIDPWRIAYLAAASAGWDRSPSGISLSAASRSLPWLDLSH